MNVQKLKEVQEKFSLIQNGLAETVSSAGGEVSLTMNGNMMVSGLTIRPGLPAGDLEPLVTATVNKAIQLMSEKIRHSMMGFQKELGM